VNPFNIASESYHDVQERSDLIFERLFRVDASRSRARGGSGLGLALCRSIAHMHQGTIRASSSTLGGLRIDVMSPVGRPA